jgi:NADPH:quinone reductase-like Zn-dependent oxidoreductase
MFAFATVNDVGQQGNPSLYPVKGKEVLITGAARGIGYLTVQNITLQKTKCLWLIFNSYYF